MHEAPEGAPLATEGLVGSTSLVVIAGPTASGKTDLAVALAHRLSGEIISADSRQVYRHFDAGTAKPDRDERGRVRGIPYHLVDCIDPDVRIDAGRFAALARPVIAAVRRRGKRPILAGGTGLYIKALLHGLDAMPPADPAIRSRLEGEARARGRQFLHDRLRKVDPAAAEKIPVNNIQRMVRALEVHALTGRPLSSFWSPKKTLEEADVFTIEWPVERLRERIITRCREMWPAMLREVKTLRLRYSGREPAFESIGYREALACTEKSLTPADGLKKFTAATLSYSKRQRTWFRHQTASVRIDGGELESMSEKVLAVLEQR